MEQQFSNRARGKGNYAFMQNPDNGEIKLLIEVRDTEIDNPRIYFDGETAVLVLDYVRSLIFKDLDQETKDALKKQEQVPVVETFDGETVKEYVAEVIIIDDVNFLIG